MTRNTKTTFDIYYDEFIARVTTDGAIANYVVGFKTRWPLDQRQGVISAFENTKATTKSFLITNQLDPHTQNHFPVKFSNNSLAEKLREQQQHAMDISNTKLSLGSGVSKNVILWHNEVDLNAYGLNHLEEDNLIAELASDISSALQTLKSDGINCLEALSPIEASLLTKEHKFISYSERKKIYISEPLEPAHPLNLEPNGNDILFITTAGQAVGLNLFNNALLRNNAITKFDDKAERANAYKVLCAHAAAENSKVLMFVNYGEEYEKFAMDNGGRFTLINPRHDCINPLYGLDREDDIVDALSKLILPILHNGNCDKDAVTLLKFASKLASNKHIDLGLSDIVEEAKPLLSFDALFLLEPYVGGGRFAKLFNGKPNVDKSSKFSVYDLHQFKNDSAMIGSVMAALTLIHIYKGDETEPKTVLAPDYGTTKNLLANFRYFSILLREARKLNSRFVCNITDASENSFVESNFTIKIYKPNNVLLAEHNEHINDSNDISSIIISSGNKSNLYTLPIHK